MKITEEKNNKKRSEKGDATVPMNIGERERSELGFVLVETIVAVALFSVVMTVSVVALLSLFQANKRTQTFKIVVNNVNLALENMSKEIRVGTGFQCKSPGVCSDIDTFTFNSRLHNPDAGDPHVVTYRLEGTAIQTRENGTGDWYSITAPDIVVEKLTFDVRGQGTSDVVSDKNQPRVMIRVSGYSGQREMDKMKFELQTTVSQRTIKD